MLHNRTTIQHLNGKWRGNIDSKNSNENLPNGHTSVSSIS